ncbi:hypothetical protein M407DRAFT_245407 [Tulasnella calospora MUT 4182]|uniref:NAD(P)-binding protein n=1 Tax=Tulasnella calospora MUT 4182 TaxID=1051891 RepID=A0A0C3QA66_9AGAM|nr:hypothetical protein M407DRAFT_245407 [Tulasnella calospora MUT 4182]
MPSLSSIRASNAAFTSAYRPTALFVGGTSGCGQGTAEAFARATQGRAHILICGRNREAAERIIETFPKHPESKYEFVQCDVTLMKNVVTAAEEVKHKITDADGKKTTLNYLVLSQGIMVMNGFDPTSEGIDKKLALHFYSRWKFVDELLPLLEKASTDGEEARVMSILDPGTGSPLDTSDLGLKNTFSLARAAKHARDYNDNFVAEYSSRHPGISFIHIYPGFVNTPGATKNLPWYLKPIAAPIAHLGGRSLGDCGEYLATGLFNPAYKAGGFYLNQDGEPVAKSKLNVDDLEARRKLVEHYTKEVAF